jgi:hypothetical protein
MTNDNKLPMYGHSRTSGVLDPASSKPPSTAFFDSKENGHELKLGTTREGMSEIAAKAASVCMRISAHRGRHFRLMVDGISA